MSGLVLYLAVLGWLCGMVKGRIDESAYYRCGTADQVLRSAYAISHSSELHDVMCHAFSGGEECLGGGLTAACHASSLCTQKPLAMPHSTAGSAEGTVGTREA